MKKIVAIKNEEETYFVNRVKLIVYKTKKNSYVVMTSELRKLTNKKKNNSCVSTKEKIVLKKDGKYFSEKTTRHGTLRR